MSLNSKNAAGRFFEIISRLDHQNTARSISAFNCTFTKRHLTSANSQDQRSTNFNAMHNEIFRSLGDINSCFNLNASKTILEI